ncbi:MAG: YHS domain-containing protein [Planctomycetota bacterium]|jgi:YHS domain-containing protein
MGENETLDSRLREAVREHRDAIRGSKDRLEAEMWERLRTEERCHDLIREILLRTIRPRLDRLTSHFVDTHVECNADDCSVTAIIARSARRGLDTRLVFRAVYELATEHIKILFEMSTLPRASDLWARSEVVIPAYQPDLNAVERFVDDHIVEAVEAHLERQRRPDRQKLAADTVDPVCGMRIARQSAAAKTTHDGEEIFFCAKVCLEAFRGNPARYTASPG